MIPYPLAPRPFGYERPERLTRVSAGVVLGIAALGEAPLTLPVTLEAEGPSGRWRVRSAHGFLGYLSGDEAARYPGLRHLKAAGAAPQTLARLSLEPGTVRVEVFLGLWPWLLPRGPQPPGSFLLAGGQGHLIDTAAGDFRPEQLEQLGACQIFVTLSLAGGDVVAGAQGRVLGPLQSPGALSHVADLVRQYAARGATLCARAFAAGGSIAVDVPPRGAEPFAPPVPALPGAPAEPAPHAAALAAVWSVEVPDSALGAGLPRGSRRLR